MVRIRPAGIIVLFLRQPRLCGFGSLCVCTACRVVGCRPPFVVVLVAGPGCCGSLVLEGSVLVGLGCAAECAGAGGIRLIGGILGGGHMVLGRSEPLTGRGLLSQAGCPQFIEP